MACAIGLDAANTIIKIRRAGADKIVVDGQLRKIVGQSMEWAVDIIGPLNFVTHRALRRFPLQMHSKLAGGGLQVLGYGDGCLLLFACRAKGCKREQDEARDFKDFSDSCLRRAMWFVAPSLAGGDGTINSAKSGI